MFHIAIEPALKLTVKLWHQSLQLVCDCSVTAELAKEAYTEDIYFWQNILLVLSKIYRDLI